MCDWATQYIQHHKGNKSLLTTEKLESGIEVHNYFLCKSVQLLLKTEGQHNQEKDSCTRSTSLAIKFIKNDVSVLDNLIT